MLLIVFYEWKNRLRSILLIFVSVCFFGGFDYLVNFLFNLTQDRSETWLTPFFCFSNTRNLFWSPQHCIPVWIMIGILGTWNDWAIKVSMPSIFLLSIFTGKQIVTMAAHRSKLLYGAGLLFVLSSLTALEELSFSASHYEISFGLPPEIRDFGPGYIVSQQLGNADSYFFEYMARER